MLYFDELLKEKVGKFIGVKLSKRNKVKER